MDLNFKTKTCLDLEQVWGLSAHSTTLTTKAQPSLNFIYIN